MANYHAIKAAVNAYIKRNGRKEITGSILNSVLNATIDSLGRYFQFAGMASPSADPGTPDQNVCYLAGEPGVYTNFGGITLGNEEIALLFWDGEWTKQGVLIGIQEVNASVDNQSGTPSVDVGYTEGVLTLTFHNIKGDPGTPGTPGAAAGFGTVGADVDGNIGTPGVTVQTSGPDTAKNLMFHFTNLKGETGVTSVVATVDNTSGTPSCQVSLVGQQLTLAFSGLKGLKGDTGVSADYPITIYNGLDSDATDAALAAAQGKVLQGEITELEAKVDEKFLEAEGAIFGVYRVEDGILFIDGEDLANTSAVNFSGDFSSSVLALTIGDWSTLSLYGSDLAITDGATGNKVMVKIVQSQGESPEDVMSQAAVTNSINGVMGLFFDGSVSAAIDNGILYLNGEEGVDVFSYSVEVADNTLGISEDGRMVVSESDGNLSFSSKYASGTTPRVTGNSSTAGESLRSYPHYSHIFIDKIYNNNVIIPSESVYDVRMSARLGFRIVEGNIQATATPGKYIVMHGVSGTIGSELYDPLGTTISAKVIAETAYDTIRSYRYNSIYEKYRTPVASLEEWLQECKVNGMTPLVTYVDDIELQIVKDIMGDNFILYGGTRKKFDGMIFAWVSASNMVSKAQALGSPCMVAATLTSLTDEELADVVKAVHNVGGLIGFAGCYETAADAQRYWKAGCDFSGSGWDVNERTVFGNLAIMTAGDDFTEFIHTGSVQADGSLLLATGQTIQPTALSSTKVAAGVLSVRYSGELTLTMGAHQNMTNAPISSDGTITQLFSTFFLDAVPTFLLTATESTTIYEITYKIDKK